MLKSGAEQFGRGLLELMAHVKGQVKHDLLVRCCRGYDICSHLSLYNLVPDHLFFRFHLLAFFLKNQVDGHSALKIASRLVDGHDMKSASYQTKGLIDGTLLLG